MFVKVVYGDCVKFYEGKALTISYPTPTINCLVIGSGLRTEKDEDRIILEIPTGPSIVTADNLTEVEADKREKPSVFIMNDEGQTIERLQ